MRLYNPISKYNLIQIYKNSETKGIVEIQNQDVVDKLTADEWIR